MKTGSDTTPLRRCRESLALLIFGLVDCAFGVLGERTALLTDGLSGIDLAVRRGERVLVIGRNGAGKSTLALLLSGFLRPRAGRAHIPGIERTSACISPHRFVPGSLRDNMKLESIEPREKEFLLSAADDFGMLDKLDSSPDEFSAGQRKKAEVLMGLAKDADLYVFDEPLANVDDESKPLIIRRMLERAAGRALVVIMHGDDEFSRDFDRIVAISPAGALPSPV